MKNYIKKHWKMIIIPVLIGWFAQVCYALIQLIMAMSFQAAFDMNLYEFLKWTGIMVVGYVLYLGVSAIESKIQAKTKMKLNNEIRHEYLKSCISKKHNTFHQKDIGEYVSSLTTNLKQLDALAWTPLFDISDQIGMIVSCSISLLFLNWVLLVVGLIVSMILIFLPNVFSNQMEKLGKICADADSKGMGNFKELISCIDIFKLYKKQDLFIKKGDMYSAEVESANCNREVAQSYIACATGFLSVLMQLLQQVVTVFLAIGGKVMIGAFASASNLTAGITNGLRAISADRMAMASAEAYFPEIENKDNENEEEIEITDIRTNDLSYQYDGKQSIHYPNMVFEKNKKYAIVGPSGCGKSTLLKIILGWNTAYVGSMKLGNVEVKNLSEEQISDKISYIDQNVSILNDTILHNITLYDDFSEEQVQNVLKQSALDKDISSFPMGLQTLTGEDGNQLSGGQKQRIAIARALLHRHSILLVDEGTSALDKKNAEIIEKQLLENKDITLILISHHLSEEDIKKFDHVYQLK